MRADPLNVGIVWDAENRLARVLQGPTELARFVYDGWGQRQQKIAGGVTHTYISDRDSLIEERVSTGQTLRYVEGPAIDQHLAMQDGAAVTYYVADHLGSVMQETSSAGAVTLARKYDPWGNMLAGASTAGWAYTGREWDAETGLAYYRARYYDPGLGRFLSEDPLKFATGVNYYTYVLNQPTTLSDPLGLDATTADPNVRRCLCEAWRDSGYGTSPTERSLWIIKNGDAYSCLRWPWTADSSQRERWHGPRPPGADSVAHTHPTRLPPSRGTRADVIPSPTDRATAKGLGMPIYVISHEGVWKYDPSCKKTTQEEKGNPSNWCN